MIQRRRIGRLRVQKQVDDFNPMDGMANLADVMLVFACGLLLASETMGEDADLERMGTVYRDPQTGKYYVVEGE